MNTTRKSDESHRPDSEWVRTGSNTLRKNEFRITKFPWGTYVLDYDGEFIGKFGSANDAKKSAIGNIFD